MPIAGFDLRVVPLLWAITALLLLCAALLLWPNIPWGACGSPGSERRA